MDETETLSDYAAGEIRAILARRRSTGKDLAEKLQVSRSWVSYRLTGTTEITLNDLQRIAAALGVEVASLLPAPTRQGTIDRWTRPAHRPTPLRRTRDLHPGAYHPTTHPGHTHPPGRSDRAGTTPAQPERPRRPRWTRDR